MVDHVIVIVIQLKAVYLPRSSLIVYCYSIFISIVTLHPFITMYPKIVIIGKKKDNK